jgi:hypothetical protein
MPSLRSTYRRAAGGLVVLGFGGADLAANVTTSGRRISLADLTTDVPLQLRVSRNGYSPFTQHLEDRWKVLLVDCDRDLRHD